MTDKTSTNIRDKLTEVIERKGPNYPAVNGPSLHIRVPYTLVVASRDRIEELETRAAELEALIKELLRQYVVVEQHLCGAGDAIRAGGPRRQVKDALREAQWAIREARGAAALRHRPVDVKETRDS